MAFEARSSDASPEVSLGEVHTPAPVVQMDPSPLPVDVFVHLAYGFDARHWRRRWENGELIGLNAPTPYGYGWAEGRVRNLEFSRDRPEGRFGRFVRLAMRAVLGFDFGHAVANRERIFASDVVWTHTESQFLAISLLGKVFKRRRRPALIGQAVWLWDVWPRLSWLRRRFYSWLITDVDVLTVHSPDNLAVARTAFPRHRVELVLFGIAADRLRRPQQRERGGRPFQLVALGNDRHRDWSCVVEAVGSLTETELTIVSTTAPASLVHAVPNACIRSVKTNRELLEIMAMADLVVVPLARNLHASGTTVLQEAAAFGVPAIASDTGGLRAYFGPDEVVYVPVGDAMALRGAIVALREDEDRRISLAQNAQSRMSRALGSRAFVERHLEISRSLAQSGRETIGQ